MLEFRDRRIRDLLGRTVLVTLTVVGTLLLVVALAIGVTLWLVSTTEPAPFLPDAATSAPPASGAAR